MRQIPEVQPNDVYNQTLLSNVHPPERVNPTPADRYHLVVLGAGTAGLITAAAAAGLGAKVALVERHLLGGDCLNVGCVPSKAIIRSSRVLGEIRAAAGLGVNVPPGTDVDFGKVMERMRRVRSEISHEDSVRRYQDELGVQVFLGQAAFTGPDTVEVDGTTLRFKKAVIATGARAWSPPVEGLAEAGFLTNETVFSLVERPRRLGVIGGGPIGCELAQAFQRLGSEVTLLEMGSHLLEREDADAAAIVQEAMLRDGVKLALDAQVVRVERTPEGKLIHYESKGDAKQVAVDEILVGAGRAPNVDDLNLEGVGVRYDKRQGVEVDDGLRTTNPRIYAAGDVCMEKKFTHAADAAAQIVVRNALFFGRRKLSQLVIPWCTYTDPEIAHVGMYEHDARAQGIEVDTYLTPFSSVDRAKADGDEEGFCKIHVKQGSDRILGATIVAPHAGEMISEITLAMVGGLGLGKVFEAIHPYPTQAMAIKANAGAFLRTRLTPGVKRLFELWFRMTS